MPRHRKDTCHVCGEPRSPRSPDRRLCETHLRMRWAEKKQHGTRTENLAAAYERLGLSVGNVWKQVRR
jgi:hypothetical protein